MAIGPYTGSGTGRPRTALLAGSFTLAGAGVPTAIGGDIVSVARRTRGGIAFFRVRWHDKAGHHLTNAATTATGHLPDALFGSFANVHVGNFVADDGGVAISTIYEMDVLVKDQANAAIDTSGIRINVMAVVSPS